MTKTGEERERVGVVLEECVGIECEQDPAKRKAFIEDTFVLLATFE
jgi:hypothetical protein